MNGHPSIRQNMESVSRPMQAVIIVLMAHPALHLMACEKACHVSIYRQRTHRKSCAHLRQQLRCRVGTGIAPGSFGRLCRRYGIETPRARQQREERLEGALKASICAELIQVGKSAIGLELFDTEESVMSRGSINKVVLIGIQVLIPKFVIRRGERRWLIRLATSEHCKTEGAPERRRVASIAVETPGRGAGQYLKR